LDFPDSFETPGNPNKKSVFYCLDFTDFCFDFAVFEFFGSTIQTKNVLGILFFLFGFPGFLIGFHRRE
jgi:hypothetical protein